MMKVLTSRSRDMLRRLAVFLLLVCILPGTASADIGPKPSVQIAFTGIEEQPYYGTLLSARRSTGPASAHDVPAIPENYPDHKPADEFEIWKAFAEYQDADGYYFLEEWWDCSETNTLRWGYYPPSPFKVLLYFPETETFRVSPIYEKYAFDSYFTIDLSASGDTLTAQRSYHYTWELVSLGARILGTIVLELALAWCFGYREKRLLRLLAAVNLVTQIALNVWLNVVNYYSGALLFTMQFVLWEFVIFIVEAVIYALMLPRLSSQPQSRGKAVGYALLANLFSFAAGLGLAHLIPGIF